MKTDAFVGPAKKLVELVENPNRHAEVRSRGVEAGQWFDQSRKVLFGILSQRLLKGDLQIIQKDITTQVELVPALHDRGRDRLAHRSGILAHPVLGQLLTEAAGHVAHKGEPRPGNPIHAEGLAGQT